MATNKLIALSGLSGAGKSTQGKMLAAEMKWEYIDLDDYYRRKNLPRIKLSNGKTYNNYDTLEALDLPSFRADILKKQKLNTVVITGFALREEVFDNIRIDIHIHLLLDKRTSLDRRKHKYRFYDAKKKQFEIMMINECVYPFYIDTLNHSRINYFIDGTLNNNIIYDKIKEYIIKHEIMNSI